MGLQLGVVWFGRAGELEELALQTLALGAGGVELLLKPWYSGVTEIGDVIGNIFVLEVETCAAAGHGEDKHVDALPPRPARDDAGGHGEVGLGEIGGTGDRG